MNRRSEKGSIEVLLQNYGDTLHPAAPSLCFFFLINVHASPAKVSKANIFREPERKTGQKRRKIYYKINSSIFEKQDQLNIGDNVLICNHTKQSLTYYLWCNHTLFEYPNYLDENIYIYIYIYIYITYILYIYIYIYILYYILSIVTVKDNWLIRGLLEILIYDYFNSPFSL